MNRSDEIRPFVIQTPELDIVELRSRLANARWPEMGNDTEGLYGISATWLREVVEYWQTRYDWRMWEARLNAYSQFTTTIDGTNIHYLHIRSSRPNALPLILTHGWPGTVAEFIDIIEPLTEPQRHGRDDALAFDLIVPSLPGFGWSGPPAGKGWGPRRIARAWSVLMNRLGYERYGAAGNDWGSHIAPELGRIAPMSVVGVHVTQLFSFPDGEWLSYPPSTESDLGPLDSEDRKSLADLRDLQRHAGAYAHVHAQRPNNLGFALNDSPVGLLAWNSAAMSDLDRDMLLTHVTITWLTNTATTSMRIYAEERLQEPSPGPTTVPLAVAQFPHDLHAIRSFAERDHANIVSWNHFPRGGHYAARQEPELLVDDMRAFFGSLWG